MTFPAQLISFINSQQDQVYYTNVGTFTTIVPAGVTMMSAVTIGGGGGGAGNDTTGTVGTGGGGGGGTSWSVFSVVPGDVLEIKVGAGGNGGTTTGNGSPGDFSHVTISSRTGVPAASGTLILRGNGGGGGTRVTGTGLGGAGGGGNDVNTTSPYFTTYLRGGGNGGAGGSSSAGGAGGGGAGGYTGNGGSGGSTTPDTLAGAGVGGGGGGGGGTDGSSNDTGYGGGGIGAYGYNGDPILDGIAGLNDTGGGGTGGGGGSFYNDPGSGINAALVGETFSTTGTISLPAGIQTGDFLLLLSGADKDGGVLNIPVPVGFTTISKSDNGVYVVDSTAGAGSTEVIPSNVLPITRATRDINFASSYRYVPANWPSILGSSISGLNSPAIHNLIALRFIPNPATIAWATESGDPAINSPSAAEMPDPPAVFNIPEGAVSIALGFLANTVLNPSNNIAGANTTFIASAEGGFAPTGVGLVASYAQGGASGTTFNPDAFLTGTASHARAYTIQINRANAGTPVSFIGSTKTGTPATPINGLGPASGTFITVPDTVQSNDLVFLATSWDSPSVPLTPTFISTPRYAGGAYGSSTSTINLPTDIYQNDIILVASSSSNGTLNTPTGYTSLRNQTGDANNPSYRLSAKRVGASIDTTVSGLSASSSTGDGTVHVALIVRGVSTTLNIASISSSVATDPGGGTAPDPPALTSTANNSGYFTFAFLDGISTTAATPPDDSNNGYRYRTAINAAVGIDETGNNEASIFTAFFEGDLNGQDIPGAGVPNGTSENPVEFGNIPDLRSWAAITLQLPPQTGLDTPTITQVEAQTSRDIRGGGGLGFRLSRLTWPTGTPSKNINVQTGTTNTPASHILFVFRGATWVASTSAAFGIDQLTPTGTLGSVSGFATATAMSVFDNGSQIAFGPPDPPPLELTANQPLVLALGFIDNVTVSNVIDITPPTDYTMLTKQSYGTNNNGAIIMSAIRLGLTAAPSEDPSRFIGGGANIWASQTIIIGGPGGENVGTNLGAGQYGGGGGSAVDSLNVAGMKGASGAVRLIWGNTRQYPASNQGNTPIIDWTP